MNIVLLDANFLLIPSQYPVDIYQELRTHLLGKLQIVLVPEVLDELHNKSKSTASTKFKRNVKLALELLNKQKDKFPHQFKSISRKNTSNLPVDDYLISLAEESLKVSTNVIYIATNDKEIRTKASLKGIGTIYMRQKKILEISA
jgi:uncharacterized protein